MPEFTDHTWTGKVLNLLSKKINPYFKKPLQLVLLAPQELLTDSPARSTYCCFMHTILERDVEISLIKCT